VKPVSPFLFYNIYIMIVRKMAVKLSVACVWVSYSFAYFTVNLFFEPMIVQDFFKDVNSLCNVLNIRQPVLQVITVLSFVSRVLKNDINVLKIVAK